MATGQHETGPDTPPPAEKGAPPARRRRLSAEARQAQILEVARATFAERGFQAATTLAVAERAAVSETLVIKYFGSKEQLFRAAVAAPLLEIVDRQIELNRSRIVDSVPSTVLQAYTETEEFVRSLARALRDNRGLFLAALDTVHRFPDVLQAILERIDSHVMDLAESVDVMSEGSDWREFRGRSTVYMTFGAAAMGALVHPDPDRYATEVVDAFFYGLLSDAGRARLTAERTAPPAP